MTRLFISKSTSSLAQTQQQSYSVPQFLQEGAITMPEPFYATESVEFQHLLSKGFTPNEAAKLLHMKEHVTEQVEYREILAESRRLNFIRWLIEHNRISR